MLWLSDPSLPNPLRTRHPRTWRCWKRSTIWLRKRRRFGPASPKWPVKGETTPAGNNRTPWYVTSGASPWCPWTVPWTCRRMFWAGCRNRGRSMLVIDPTQGFSNPCHLDIELRGAWTEPEEDNIPSTPEAHSPPRPCPPPVV